VHSRSRTLDDALVGQIAKSIISIALSPLRHTWIIARYRARQPVQRS
jgi:hypothetical protein